MGQSTDAILAFGIDLGEEVEWPAALIEDEDDTYPDLGRYLACKAGVVEGDDYSAFYRQKRALEDAFPLDIVGHCSGDYRMWVLALKDTVQRANRGYPKVPSMREITESDRKAIKDFCEEVGLPWEEPSWLLFSDWN